MSVKEKNVSFCETCISNGRGVAMTEVEARLHQDHNPNHRIVTADIDQNKESEHE